MVTGGAGFVGSHLVEALVKRGDSRVISLDNYFTGRQENHILGAEYREGATADIERLIPESPALVFHLGEYSRVEQSFADLETVWQFNVAGTFAVLEFCRARGAKLLYAGSSTKFGDGGAGRHQSPYAWSKAANTELVMNYGQWFGLPYAITYFYNVYGEREIAEGTYATLIAKYKKRYQRGLPLEVVLPGTQRRNFTHVADIVRGLMLVGERGVGDGYALGAEESYSILEIAQLFGGEIVMLPERTGNRLSAGLDLSRSRGELGWQAEQRIEDHIRDFVAQEERRQVRG